MSVSAGDAPLFIFGLVPQYVSVIAVEKHFTNFWAGFWNIYGLIEVVVSLTITSDNPTLILSGILLIGILILVLLISLQPGFAVLQGVSVLVWLLPAFRGVCSSGSLAITSYSSESIPSALFSSFSRLSNKH